jgi:sugar O-acyltransferase (sialic acid O-acetyltransferase NeuD family)
MEKVVLFGNTPWSEIVYYYLTQDSAYEVVAFSVDEAYIKEQTFCGLPLVPFEKVEDIYPPSEYKMMLTVLVKDINKVRARKFAQAKEKGYTLISYISSRATVWPDLVIGENCFIGEDTLCRPRLKIGNDVIVMGGSYLGHHAEIKDHCFLSGRVSLLGAAVIEPYCTLGPNAVVLDTITVATECVIGAGCVIRTNTKPKQVFRAVSPELLPIPSDKMSGLLFHKFTKAEDSAT